MGRIIFQRKNQAEYLRNIKSSTGSSTRQLAVICNVSPRTFRDWLVGKYSISEKALTILINKFSLKWPENIKVVNDYWYVTKGARKGALRRLELYGSLGTFESRRKGGVNSQLRRRENPEKYRLLGCNIRKNFNIEEVSTEFAEAIGIILGDGAINNYQLRITVSSLVDRAYADFVVDLFYKVFKEKPSLMERVDCHTLNITLSGIGLISELERYGLVKGNKVKHQVDFPEWIWRDIEFQKACIRGLMDTDGGCYFHKHKVNGLIYRNFGMSFANKSLPLVHSFTEVLKSLGLKFSVTNNGTQIYMYSFKGVKKYFELIGSHNQKNNKKFEYYLNQKTHRVVGNKEQVGCERGRFGDIGNVVYP